MDSLMVDGWIDGWMEWDVGCTVGINENRI